jgi:hypothetical protein
VDTLDVWQQGLVDHEQSVVDEMKKMAERQRVQASS